jgi:hypothetical protein
LADATSFAEKTIVARGIGPIHVHYNLIRTAINDNEAECSTKGYIVHVNSPEIFSKMWLVCGIWPFQANAGVPGLEGILVGCLCHHEATGDHPELYAAYTAWCRLFWHRKVAQTGVHSAAVYVKDNYYMGPLHEVEGEINRMLREDSGASNCCVCMENFTESSPLFDCHCGGVCLNCGTCDDIKTCPLCRAQKSKLQYCQNRKNMSGVVLGDVDKALEALKIELIKCTDMEEVELFSKLHAAEYGSTRSDSQIAVREAMWHEGGISRELVESQGAIDAVTDTIKNSCI